MVIICVAIGPRKWKSNFIAGHVKKIVYDKLILGYCLD